MVTNTLVLKICLQCINDILEFERINNATNT